MSNITSELAYAVTSAAVIWLGFIKVFMPSFPLDAVLTALVTLAGLYFGKRLVQKNRMFINNEQTVHSEQLNNSVSPTGERGLSED